MIIGIRVVLQRSFSIMNIRLLVLAAGLSFAGVAVAQDSETTAVRASMYESANSIFESISSGPGPLDTMLGINRAASLSYSLDDAQRQNWQYWPTARVGLPVENMSGDQKKLTHKLLRGALSSNGYLKVVHIMQLEQILDMLDQGGFPRSVDHYRLVLFGTPSMDEPWAWRFEGHHVSLSVAVSPNGIRVTPSFFGSNPAEVVSGPLTGFRVHGTVEDLARGLVGSLTQRERGATVLSTTAPREIFSGNIGKESSEWEAWRDTLRPEGITVGDLNEMQQFWVAQIIDEVIGNYRPEVGGNYARAIDIPSLKFVWMGSSEFGEPHYFRLQGGDFVFEFDNVQNNGNHVHSVWRDMGSDFGTDVLAEHYRTSHSR
jgi:hypothetical protein